MKARTSFAIRCLFAATVTGVLLGGCGNLPGTGSSLDIDDLHRHVDDLAPGDSFSLYLTDLRPAAQHQYLAEMGRPDADPASYSGVPIVYEAMGHLQTRGSRSRCGSMVRRIGHSPWCHKPGYETEKEPIPNNSRCAHGGYTSARDAYLKTSSCLKPRCTYLYERRWYYHERI